MAQGGLSPVGVGWLSPTNALCYVPLSARSRPPKKRGVITDPFRKSKYGRGITPTNITPGFWGSVGVQLVAVRIPPSQALKACPALLKRCPPFNDQVLHPKTQLASTRLSPDHTVEYSPFLTSRECLRRVSQANLGRRLGNDIELQLPPAVEHPGATQTRQYVDA